VALSIIFYRRGAALFHCRSGLREYHRALYDRQGRWLLRSDARWNLLGQQVMIAQNDREAGPGEEYDVDNWDGYRPQRRRVLELFGSGLIDNPVGPDRRPPPHLGLRPQDRLR
jgi:phosphodiesterase/alkaline phosphatase D-like protein